ncbi:MAG: hypothetical protein GEU78_18385, partial [Actinobacteria bacterium]|nr:hypothetical protein [Actinomycetota bacterium]
HVSILLAESHPPPDPGQFTQLGTSRSGKVLRDIAVTLADGGDALRHMKVMGGQPKLFGPVASAATANRTLVAVAADDAAVAVLDTARKAARQVAWRNGAAPPVVAAALDGQRPDEPLCFDLDATLITAHSDDKDGAGKTYKRTWGFHPLGAWLDRGDGLGEALAAKLRPGNAGAVRHEVARVEWTQPKGGRLMPRV